MALAVASRYVVDAYSLPRAPIDNYSALTQKLKAANPSWNDGMKPGAVMVAILRHGRHSAS